jgi:predicted O-methyltransferase YrrM
MSIFDNVIIKTLSLNFVEKPVEYLWHLYHLARLNNAKNHTLRDAYRVIAEHRLDITSDFSHRDAEALLQVVQVALTECMVVGEIGSWKGMSTSVLAKAVKNWKGKVYAIDHWKGSENVPEHKQASINDMFSLFRNNMKTLGVMDIIHPLVMDSVEASDIFKDNSLDLLFIDADHRYFYVKRDIEIWLPKVKSGGIICGHDCEEKYTKFGEFKNEIDKHCEEDVIVGICHAGVVKALYDVFHDNYEIIPNSSVWWYRKG